MLHSTRRFTLSVALLVASAVVSGVAQAQPAPRGPGTYEITWFSINTATEQRTVAKLLLVLSATPLPDSLTSVMDPGRSMPRTTVTPRACWRITAGAAAMNGAGPRATSTEWTSVSGDVAVQLWFHIDAGSSLQFSLIGDSLRGQIVSSGWMEGPGGRARPREVRDSVIGRRVGEPDPSRCLRVAPANDSTLIAIAKRASVRTLDSTLASTPFAAWLATLRPLPSSRVHWGVNDCGEGGDGRTAPFCVEAKLDLAPDTAAYVYLITAGSDRVAGPPAIFMVFAIAGKTTLQFKTLAAWAAFVRPRKP